METEIRKHIITRNVQIIVDCDELEQCNKHYGTLRYYANECTKMANFIVSQQFVNMQIKERIILNNDDLRNKSLKLDTEISALEQEFGQTPSKDKENRNRIKERKKELFKEKKEFNTTLIELEKDFYRKSGNETSPQNSTYQLISVKFPNIPSYVRASVNDIIYKNLKKDYIDILKGIKSIRNYKSCPISFSKAAIRNLKFDETKKSFTFICFGIPFFINLGKDASNNKIILERILSNEYQMGDLSISYKDNKWFANLIVKIPIKNNLELSDNICVGVDLGIKVPIAIVSTNDKWGKFIGDTNLLFHKKKAFASQKRTISIGLSTTKGGHGYKSKMKKFLDLKNAESNYTNTLLHTLAKQVVEYTISQGAKIIKMEFLEGFAQQDQEKKTLVRFWSPRRLQNLIEEKAIQNDIQILYVDPYKTSQTCPDCGSQIEEQRESQNLFICKNKSCAKEGKKQNADRIAANNICKSEKKVSSISDCTISKIKLELFENPC